MPKAAAGENDHVLGTDLSPLTLFGGVAGKVVCVTGGSSGIGAMIAAGFVASSARVFICSRKDGSDWAAQLAAKGPGTCTAVSADLTAQPDVDALLATIGEVAGGQLHVLVNNSGANWAEPLGEYSMDGWAKVMDLNAGALFNLTQCALPLLEAGSLDGDPTRVINIGSIDGLTVPALETYAYSTSKSAVVHMTKVLAGHLVERGITCNSICPGAFQSRMMRKTIEVAGDELGGEWLSGRIGEPSDMAGTCVFLASRAAAWMTGANLVLDGGNIVRPRL